MFATLPLLLIVMFQGFLCLRDVRLSLPAAVKSGDSMPISCSYQLDRDTLYSVKFYLEDTEFFRFLPRDIPSTRVFPLQDASIFLKESRLNKSTVILGPLHRHLAGLYKCEVSGDAPLFHTIITSSYVTVTEDPVSHPSLVTSKFTYKLGEIVTAQCTSQGGYPPVNFTWFLNDQRISDSTEHRIRNYMMAGDVDSSVSELLLRVSPTTSDRGTIRLRCVASQFAVYYAAADSVLKEEPSISTPVINGTVSFCSASIYSLSSILIFCVIYFC